MKKDLEEQREFVRQALDLGKRQGASAVHVLCGNTESQSVSFASGRLKEGSQASSEKFTYLSSTIVKEMARYGADLQGFVPANVIERIMQKV